MQKIKRFRGSPAQDYFSGFNSVKKFEPTSSFINKNILYTGSFSGKLITKVKDSSFGFHGQAKGELNFCFEGKCIVKRFFRIPPNETLKLTYLSNDSDSIIEDYVYMSENSKLDYVGKFVCEKNKFKNFVKIIHEEPNAKSEVNIKGIVSSKVDIITSAEVLEGSKGSKVSLNSIVFLFDEGRVNALPELNVETPFSRVSHSFRKIKFTPEQLFYLESRKVKMDDIKNFQKKTLLGV